MGVKNTPSGILFPEFRFWHSHWPVQTGKFLRQSVPIKWHQEFLSSCVIVTKYLAINSLNKEEFGLPHSFRVQPLMIGNTSRQKWLLTVETETWGSWWSLCVYSQKAKRGEVSFLLHAPLNQSGHRMIGSVQIYGLSPFLRLLWKTLADTHRCVSPSDSKSSQQRRLTFTPCTFTLWNGFSKRQTQLT